MTETPPPVLVIGVGNLLMGDDGIGCRVLAELQRDPPPGTRLIDAGTAVVNLLADLEQAAAVLFIDAFQRGGAAGSTYVLEAQDVAAPALRASLHDVGLASALRWLAPAHRAKPMLLLGIEPACLDFGAELSAPLREAMPAVLGTARSLIRHLRDPSFSLRHFQTSLQPLEPSTAGTAP